MKKILSALLVSATTLAAVPSFATVVNFGGTSSGGGDCTFTCTSHLQQEYTAAAFGDTPVEISRVSFFFNYYGPNNNWFGSTQPGSWQVSLANNANGSGLTSAFASNVGASNAVFANGQGTVTVPNRVDFTGSFVYDPTAGNLLLDILGPGYYNGSFTATGSVNRIYAWDNDAFGNVDYGYGISTEFEVGAPSNNVPEPATLGLLAVGLAGIAFGKRRKLS